MPRLVYFYDSATTGEHIEIAAGQSEDDFSHSGPTRPDQWQNSNPCVDVALFRAGKSSLNGSNCPGRETPRPRVFDPWICFFYKEVLGKPLQGVDSLRVTRPAHLRHAPTPKDTRARLVTVGDEASYPTNLVAQLLYRCWLRVSERKRGILVLPHELSKVSS